MTSFYELDYGYKVRVLTGEHKDQEGSIVMGSRFGHVGIDFNTPPTLGHYEITVQQNKH